MRILLVTLVFSPDGVSTASLMTDLALELKRCGHDLTVVTTTPHYNHEPESRARQQLQRRWAGWLYTSELDTIRVHHVKVAPKGQRVLSRALDYLRFHVVGTVIGLLRAGTYDVVIAPTPPLTIGLHAWLLARARGAKFVYNVQEIYPDVAVRLGVLRPGVMTRALDRMQRNTYARADRVVVISEYFHQRLAEKGVDAIKLRVIPNFVDTEFIRPLERRNAFAERYGLVDKFVVLYSGNVGLTQDLEGVLHAAAEVRDLDDVRFVIAGDGARREWLERELGTGAHPNVLLLEYQPKSVVPLLYASCDVGIIPLRRAAAHDTFPSKIYAIMASGRAVIAAAEADTELASVITGAGCGTIIDPEHPDLLAAAIRDLHGDPARARCLGERGRAYVVAQHSRAAIGRQYDELLRDLVQDA